MPLPASEAGPAVPPIIPPLAAPDHGLRTADRPYAVRPVPPPPSRAMLRVLEPGGREREVRVEGHPLTLGRAPDNGLVIADARVSRHHGRFQARHGTLVYTDLGSTNGTRVNGIRVDEIVLGPGDRLQIGDVVLVVEQLPR
ncbi:MAG TPA: FHA domain-containing protein [Candidatus Limnocylindrales bacterium]